MRTTAPSLRRTRWALPPIPLPPCGGAAKTLTIGLSRRRECAGTRSGHRPPLLPCRRRPRRSPQPPDEPPWLMEGRGARGRGAAAWRSGPGHLQPGALPPLPTGWWRRCAWTAAPPSPSCCTRRRPRVGTRTERPRWWARRVGPRGRRRCRCGEMRRTRPAGSSRPLSRRRAHTPAPTPEAQCTSPRTAAPAHWAMGPAWTLASSPWTRGWRGRTSARGSGAAASPPSGRRKGRRARPCASGGSAACPPGPYQQA